jgi:hypothetical protein
VSMDNPELLKKISALNPYTISWNNVVDYMDPWKFHQLARKCSAPEDTVHFAYSMNWSVFTKGASVLDYPSGDKLKLILKTSRQAIGTLMSLGGVSRYFQTPPIDNPMNIADVSCSLAVRKHWCDDFFKDVENVGEIEPSFYSVFARMNNVLFFTWSYDSRISFRPSHN